MIFFLADLNDLRRRWPCLREALRGGELACQEPESELSRQALTASESERAKPQRPRGQRANDGVVVDASSRARHIMEAAFDDDTEAATVSAARELTLKPLPASSDAVCQVGGRLALDHRSVRMGSEDKIASLKARSLERPA
jgi:hypothetical protein